VAVTVTGVFVETAGVVSVKFALVVPAAMVNDDAFDVMLDGVTDRSTVAPPAGAGDPRETLPLTA